MRGNAMILYSLFVMALSCTCVIGQQLFLPRVASTDSHVLYKIRSELRNVIFKTLPSIAGP